MLNLDAALHVTIVLIVFVGQTLENWQRYQTSQYLKDCLLDHFKFSEIPNIDNLGLFTFQEILEFVVDSFLKENVILMSNLYNNYKDMILMNADIYCFQFSEFELTNLCHSTQWLFRMLKRKLGSSLLFFTPKNKKCGLMFPQEPCVLSYFMFA